MNLFQLLFGDWLQLLFDFGGRINRAKYWLSFLIYFAALFILYILALVVAALIGIPDLAALFAVLSFIPIVISCTAIGVKRLHDRNKSGRWLLVFYVLPSLLGGLGWYAGYPTPFQLMGVIVSIWGMVELGFLRGTRGRNYYGPDPLAVGNARIRR
jgi:uncharacterized membrane protein YhaH (DUF805 family)